MSLAQSVGGAWVAASREVYACICRRRYYFAPCLPDLSPESLSFCLSAGILVSPASPAMPVLPPPPAARADDSGIVYASSNKHPNELAILVFLFVLGILVVVLAFIALLCVRERAHNAKAVKYRPSRRPFVRTSPSTRRHRDLRGYYATTPRTLHAPKYMRHTSSSKAKRVSSGRSAHTTTSPTPMMTTTQPPTTVEKPLPPTPPAPIARQTTHIPGNMARKER